jgi:hypothetical protein
MGRKEWYVFIAFLLIFPIINITQKSEGASVFGSENEITIEGDIELILSEYFVSGSGTQNDPAILGNFPDNMSNLKIMNITSWIKIKDLNFTRDHSNYFLSLTKISGCYLENLTLINREKLIFVDAQNDVEIMNSTLLCTQNGKEFMDMLRITSKAHIAIGNSSLMCENSYYRTYYNVNIFSSRSLSINDSWFDNVVLGSGELGTTFVMNGCHFSNGTIIRIYNRYPRSPNFIRNCYFNDSAYDTRHNTDLHILNNTFQNGIAGLIFGWIDPYPHIKYPSELKNNIFESCKGLDIVHGYYGSSKVMKNWNITDNYFGNCSGPAIDWSENIENVDDIHVWRNIFYHNGGTGDNLSSTFQVDVQYGYQTTNTYFNFSKDNVGNYWRDYCSPDVDGNGIVDTPLMVHSSTYGGKWRNITDYFPVTNPYFDLTRPYLKITEPVNTTTEIEYTRIEWEAWDNETGLDKVSFSTDNENWTDVTDEDWWSVNLSLGENWIFLKAFDRAGLFNLSTKTINLDRITGPITLDSPGEGDILLDDRVRINWTVSDYFDLSEQKLFIDDKEVHTSKEDRTAAVKLSEGQHEAALTCWDENDCNLTESINFLVDTFNPVTTIGSPKNGMTYNNELMNFQWSVYDHNEIVSMSYRLNDGNFVEIDGTEYSFSELIGYGEHRFEVRAEDIAGRVSDHVLFFQIYPESIIITSPEDEFVTKEEKVVVEWTIDERFDQMIVHLFNLDMRSTINVTGKTSLEVDLTPEGRNLITITARDIFGNMLTDWITIYRDIEPPTIQIMNKVNWTNDQPLKIIWSTTDNHGIGRYLCRFDNGPWEEIIGPAINLGKLEEADHRFEVICFDLAGNSANDSYDFTYDITPPVVVFKEIEDPLIQKEPVLNIGWIAQDMGEISNFTLQVDDYEVIMDPATFDWSGILDDGHHTIKIIAIDKAGNSGNDTKEVIIDTSAPLLFWDKENPMITSKTKFNISFHVEDNIGINEVILQEDGNIIWSGVAPVMFNVLTGPLEGIHEYSLTAIDIANRSARITCSIKVDRTPPELRSFEHTIEDGSNIVRWETFDVASSVENVIISINGETSTFSGPEGKWDLGNIKEGTYDVNMTIIDTAGNSVFITNELRIGGSGEEDEGEKSGSSIWIIVVMLILFAIAVIGGVFYFIRFRRSDKPIPEEEGLTFVVEPEVERLDPAKQIPHPRLNETKIPTLGPAKLKMKDGNPDNLSLEKETTD